jgi:serine-type D-Ala-D-Ala carboxypeptidase/endopeptidase (penicillin-binding protein 4)
VRSLRAEFRRRTLVSARMLLQSALLVFTCTASLADTRTSELAPAAIVRLAGNGSVLLRSPAGEDLVRINPDRSLLPASLVKIPMAHVALTSLGEDYRFRTEFYRNDAGDLLIRGYGDPFLVSEEIADIARHLAERGVKRIARLVLDDSAFAPDFLVPGQTPTLQPYGAINGALVVNFNTVNLAWSQDGELLSGEPQTPLTPLARQLARGLPRGQPQRINLGDDPLNGLQQVQQLFQLMLEVADIPVMDSSFHREAVSAEWTLLYSHLSSRSLRDNLEGLLHFSNNFIANQLFLTTGALVHGYPATMAASREVLVTRLQNLYGENYGANADTLLMTEGSGLDRAQRMSGQAMMHILETFQPHADLLDQVNGVYRKSGTLTGVYNFAGYIPGPGGLYPFVIITNQSSNQRAAILTALQSRVARN